MDTTSEPGFAGPSIPGYRLLSSMSKTPMSEVFRAEETGQPGRLVALKVVPTFGARPASAERFRTEIRIAKELNHPNIVETYDSGETEDYHYFAMRLVAGRDLGRLLIHNGPLDIDRTIDIAYQVAGALDAAHARKLVHRDVKPGNILIDDETGRVFLCDFGIAKDLLAPAITHGAPPFTPLYAAPEQQLGPVDHRADVYALAGVVFACLTGHAPFEHSADTREVLAAQRKTAPPRVTALRPDLPAGVDEVLAIGLAKRPADRYDSCTDLVDDLIAVVHGGTRVRRRRPVPRRGRLLIGGALVAVITLVLWFTQPWRGSASAEISWVPGAFRPTCQSAGMVPNSTATATCQLDGATILFAQFATVDALNIAYAKAVSAAGITRDTGDCTTATGAEHEYPAVGPRAGRVVCAVAGPTSTVDWTDTADRALAQATEPAANDAKLRQSWSGWVGIPAFPTTAERNLVNLVGERGCRRTPAGALDAYADTLAAVDCTPADVGATGETYVQFSSLTPLRAAFDGDAATAKETTGVDCATGQAPGFLGNRRFDLRSVVIGGLQCHPGANSSLVMEWSVEPLLVLGKATGVSATGLASWWSAYYGPPTGTIAAAVAKQDSPPFPTAAESALLAHIPQASQHNCMRVSAAQARLNVGNYPVTGVVCGPTTGAPIVFYYQFNNDTDMNAAYGVPQPDGQDCTNPANGFGGEHSYTRAGQTGRLECFTPDNTQDRDMQWTDDQLAIETFAFQGRDPAAMLDWWTNDAGPG